MFPVLAHGATYYVAKTGSNSNSCVNAQSQSTPKLTITAGLGCMRAGDTLIVKAGTYVEVVRANIPSGTAGNPTILKANPGDTVIIAADLAAYQASGSSINCMVEFTDLSYVTFDGFIVDMGNFNGMPSGINSGVLGVCAMGTTNHFTMQNTEIRNTITDSSYFPTGYFSARGTDSNLITNNHIHHIGTSPANGNSYYGMYCAGSNHVFDGNHIHHTGKYGMHMYDGQSQSIINNVYKNNYIHDTQNSAILLGGTHGALVYNNILLGPAGLDSTWSAIYLGFGTDNAQIYNNTIYNCLGYPVGLRAGETTNVIIRNNIASQCGRTMVENAAQALAIDHNLNFTGGSVVDPLFINAAANDFHLR